MIVHKRKPKRFRQFLFSAFGIMLVGYFLYHTIEGNRGWFAMLRMQNEVKSAEKTLVRLQEKRKELDHRTQLLKKASLDPDLLDEKSRELLNYSKPNEIIILMPKNEKK